MKSMTKRMTAPALALLLGVGASAEAAPTKPQTPTASPRTAPPLALRSLVVAALPATIGCGEVSRVRLRLTNRSQKAQAGTIFFSDSSGQLRTLPYQVDAALGTEREIEVKGTALDCSRSLGMSVRVKSSDGAMLLSKRYEAKSFAMEQGFPMPVATETRPWLRRVALTGSCASATATAMVTALSGGKPSQDVHVTLAVGGDTKTVTGTVKPNETVALSSPVPISCATSGIPSVAFALLDGVATSGTLRPQSVTFE